ncbi:anti-repressor SinI family protein [Rossellomorea aquimaris]|nr:anti-repressor SinI family protein [Rossellomorea aquimaris]
MMTNRELDLEWMELIKQALDAGISKSEIREFLHSQSPEKMAEFKAI